jgi:hypothetical protein
MEEHRNRYFLAAGCAIALLLVSFQSAFGATKPDGTLEITDGKEQFMSTLSSMPYTKSGAGPILYVLECSAFPPTQAFERDWKGQLDGVEVRRIFVAVNPATANEAGYLARTRNIDDFYAFMNRTKVAPTITSQDKAGVAAAQSMIQPFGKVLKPIMIKNGWSKDSPAPPQFMWETNGRVYAGSYSKDSFPVILSMLRSGTQTAQASASHSRTPASDSASTPNDSSVAETAGQPMSAQKNGPQPVDEAQTSNNRPMSTGSGGSGPDVIGLRIGTTPAEARAIFKSRAPVSDSLRKGYSYRERISALSINAPAQGMSGPVPKGKYLNTISVAANLDSGSIEQLGVAFTPVPGHEGIVSLSRNVSFSAGKKPTYDAFEKTLVEKHGTPTYYTVGLSIWSYDSNGVLQKDRNKEEMLFCENMIERLVAGQFATDWVLSLRQNMFASVPPEQMPAKCGAVFLSVQPHKYSAGNPGGGALVDVHDTYMVGFDAAIRAWKEARAIIDNASADASAAAIKKGQQRKPDL